MFKDKLFFQRSNVHANVGCVPTGYRLANYDYGLEVYRSRVRLSSVAIVYGDE